MRWVVDRRAQPSENNGTLTIAGERGEVLKAAVEHAVPSRGHTDSEELRSAIESARARSRRRVSARPAAAAPPGSIEMGGLGRYVAHRAAPVHEDIGHSCNLILLCTNVIRMPITDGK